MNPSLTALLIGAACAVAHMAMTLVLLRLPGRTSPVMRHAASAAVTHLAGVIAAMWFGPVPYWPIAAVGGFGAVAWLFVFSAVYKSVSLRILSQLARVEGNELPLETVTTDYVMPEFAARVDVLRNMGCAEPVGAGDALTAKGAATAKRILAVQKLCGIERSGLYGEAASKRAA
ncbi:MAG: hypothetical protein U0791_03505 [Gemmataceae bacterium]